MKLTDVKSSIYIDFSKEINDEYPKFKISGTVRISKYKNVFGKGYSLNCSEEVFVKNTVPWTYVISDLKGGELVGTFYKKELQKTNQNSLELKR